MNLPDTVKVLPKWTKNEFNKWADYIELSCLDDPDYYFAIDDMIDHYSDERPDDLDRGSPKHAEKFDKLSSKMKNYFALIQFRADSLGESYPFEVGEGNSITLKKDLSESHLFYLLLLFCSHTSFFDRSTMNTLTHAFEDISAEFLRIISPMSAITEVFGTSRSQQTYVGTQRERITALATNIFTRPTRQFDEDPKFNVYSGDGGLDLISYLQIDDQPYIPLSFAQCACSYDDWEDKQDSINSTTWNKRLGEIAPYLEFTFIPFYYRLANGDFESNSSIRTCIMDRHRFFKIAELDATVFQRIIRHPIFEWMHINILSGIIKR